MAPRIFFASDRKVQYTSGGFKRFPMAEFKQLVTEQRLPESLAREQGAMLDGFYGKLRQASHNIGHQFEEPPVMVYNHVTLPTPAWLTLCFLGKLIVVQHSDGSFSGLCACRILRAARASVCVCGI